MISGAHVVLYSRDAAADRAFLRDVIGLDPGVDAGDGWLIFPLPPAEVAVHPAAVNDRHELFFLCDVEATVSALSARGATLTPVEDQGWGRLTHVGLPGGGRIGLYQPRHPSPAR